MSEEFVGAALEVDSVTCKALYALSVTVVAFGVTALTGVWKIPDSSSHGSSS